MQNHPVLCSGSYFATRDGMVDLETELLDEVRTAKCHKKGVPSDQGYVNYLYWAGRLPYATAEIRGDGIVNTVGALMGKNHGGSIGKPGSRHHQQQRPMKPFAPASTNKFNDPCSCFILPNMPVRVCVLFLILECRYLRWASRATARRLLWF